MSEIRVVPAILTDDSKTLKTMVQQAETFTNYVQFDIMDGQFVPSQSITWEHLSGLSMKISWEVHLMVLKPEAYLGDFQRAGAKKIVFHYEATSSPREVISMIKNLGLQAGLAVNPETHVSAVLPLSAEVDSVLFLSVHPGFYGSEFLPEVLEKIVEFRSAQPEVEIGIDGGIKESNIAEVARCGVNTIYVGSAISLHPQPGKSYRHLLSLANGNQL